MPEVPPSRASLAPTDLSQPKLFVTALNDHISRTGQFAFTSNANLSHYVAAFFWAPDALNPLDAGFRHDSYAFGNR
ncbi:hypothetical protein [Pseudomonas syringae]|jgi:hypothetical protein|uniref:hypothetical protein n=1 Tax=Pseudomonas syringae TaxID=317 RepID=UPI0018A23333|nr:hypothetical protein [Pseudomonas syringae]